MSIPSRRTRYTQGRDRKNSPHSVREEVPNSFAVEDDGSVLAVQQERISRQSTHLSEALTDS
jgi:hypothetical protein